MASRHREISLLPSELIFRQDYYDVFSDDYNNNDDDYKKKKNIMVSVSKRLPIFESSCFSSCGSAYLSWSDFSSPVSSEPGSTSSESTVGSEEDEELFISELTRQMAEYMLRDDDDNDDITNHGYENSEKPNKSENPTSVFADVKNENTMLCPSDYSTHDDEQFPPLQVYQLKNQPKMRKQGSNGGGKRVKATELTQDIIKDIIKEQQNKGKLRRYSHGKKTRNVFPLLPSPPPPPVGGSGMRAVFLGGSERNGSSGTGVFLPSGTYITQPPKRKSGYSTVLIPARVLQTLQQHFTAVGGLSPSNTSVASTNLPWQNDVLARINGLLSQKKEHAEFQTRPVSPAAEMNHHHPEVVQLPQEWTY